MKHKKKQAKRIDLDSEVVADLEATDAETEAIHGGRTTNGTVTSGSWSNGPAGSTAT